ncbi:MAG: flagellin lysine-N-methylase [Lachnospiraceae bacterium]|nr:flagellin lysine-N-methylase [Lachnospiraceae bacterium]
MKTNVISFYHEFHCLAGACPHSCCRGWQIPVDEATYQRYQSLKGLRGYSLRRHIKRGEPHVIRPVLFRCPFENSDHLCQHQCNGQTDLMPLVCRVYPRHSVSYGSFTEVTFEASCPVIAAMLVKQRERLTFLSYDHPVDPVWVMENEDEEFLDFLLRDREKILDFLWAKERPLHEQMQAIYAYTRQENDWISRNHMEHLSEVALSYDPTVQGDYAIERPGGYAFYPIATIDRMLLEHVDYGNLLLRSPKLYRLIRRYDQTFRKMNVREADVFFHEKILEMLATDPTLEDKYRSYYSYNLQQLYLQAYETYFVLRQTLLATLYTQLLILFDLLDYLENGRVSDEERQSEVLMLLEIGCRHNPKMTENLFWVIRNDFL